MQQALTYAKKHILLNLILFSCATLAITAYTSKIMASDINSGQKIIEKNAKEASVISSSASEATSNTTTEKTTLQPTATATEQSATAGSSATREITTSGAEKQISTNLATTATANTTATTTTKNDKNIQTAVATTATTNSKNTTNQTISGNALTSTGIKKNPDTGNGLINISPTFTFTSPQDGKTVQDKITISGTVNNAQNVEFYLIQENSDAQKYIGTAAKQSENTWGMNFNLDNTPNGSFFLIAKIENVYTTYESGKIKITINSYPHSSTNNNQTAPGNDQSTIIFESPKEKGPIEKNIYKVTNISTVKVGNENKLKLEGKGLPNTFVTVYIYSSLPIILTVKTDSDGNWSYLLDKQLDNGEHEAYVAVTDNTGKITAKSEPLPFIKTAEAVTVIDPANAAERAKAALPPTQTRTSSDMLIITAIILLSLGLVFSIISLTVVYKAEKKNV
jgi:hypothetical protein